MKTNKEELTEEDRMMYASAIALSNAFTEMIEDDDTVEVFIVAIAIMLSSQSGSREELEELLDELRQGALYTYEGSTILYRSK